MKPSLSFAIKTAIIVGASVWLALAFNAARTDRLPLVQDPEDRARIAAQRGEISLAEATLLVQSGQAVFLDAREADEFALGHIEGALSLDPLTFGQDFQALRAHMEGKTVVTYCDGELCELSHELAEQLRSMGLEDVRVLRNGWSLWRDQGLPTATGGQKVPRDATPEPTVEEGEGTNASAPDAPEVETPEAMETAPAAEAFRPEPPENATDETESNGTTETPETQALDPEHVSLPEARPALDAAPPQPAPTGPAASDPQEAPSPEPQQDDNPPATETQGEHS